MDPSKRERRPQGNRPLACPLIVYWTDHAGTQRAHETVRATEASALVARLRSEGLEPFTGARAAVQQHRACPGLAETMRRMAGAGA